MMHHHSHHGGQAGGLLSTYAGIAVRLLAVVLVAFYAAITALACAFKGDMHQAVAQLIVGGVLHFFAMPVKGDVARLNAWVAAKRKAR